MKTKLIILGVAMLISANYAKSQCTTPVSNSGASGTQYYIPKYSQTGDPCLQNSSIYDNGNVGIGTTSPGSFKLYINGNTYESGTFTSSGLIVAVAGIQNNSGQGVAHVHASNCFYGTEWSFTISNGGTYNAFMGVNSGGGNTSGSYNTHLGAYAGYYNSTGSGNTTTGYYAGLGTNSNNYSNNSFFGYKAGFATTTGGNNVFVGYQAGTANTYAAENVAVGYNALATQSYGSTLWNSYNVAIGNNALYSNQPTSTTTAYHNTAVGDGAGYSNTTGSLNTFLGSNAGRSNTSGVFNTFVGYQAGYTTSTASNCTYAGYAAGYYTTGADNSFFGYRAGVNTSTGTYNTAVGESAGNTNTTGSNNTYLGYNADGAANNYSNSMALGNGAQTDGSNHLYIGNASITKAWVQVNWTIGSDRRIKSNIQQNVPGLAFINLLKPVTYHYDVDKENELRGIANVSISDSTHFANNCEGKYDIEKIQFTGLIAQQVDSAAQKIGYDFSGIDKSSTTMGLRYAEFVVPLIKAVQELSSTVDSLKSEIALLQNTAPATPENPANTQQVTLSNAALLYQNEPNPFDSKTIIRYFIPANTAGIAYIVFYDVYGNEMGKNEIAQKGNGQIEVNAANLSSGIYSYSLIVNGSVIETKKMMKSK